MNQTSTFAGYIAELLEPRPKGRGLKRSQIAAYTGVAHTTVMDWLRGSRPKPETIEKLARALNEEPGRLLQLAGYPASMTGSQPSSEQTFASSNLPATPEETLRRIVEMASAGLSAVPVQGRIRMIPVQDSYLHAGEGGVEVEYVQLPEAEAGEHVACYRLRGDCMVPDVNPGDLVFVDKDAPYRDGEMVAVELEDEIVIRWYMERAGILEANQGHPPIPVSEAKAIWLVIGSYRKPERRRILSR